MRARSFFYASLGVLALAIAFHLGARSATAQAPSNPVVSGWATSFGGGAASVVVTANGDVYQGPPLGIGPWTYGGNVFTGGPTPARQESFGAVKARYR